MAAIPQGSADITNGILLADHPGNWRTAVADGLRTGRHPVLVVEDGTQVLRALTDLASAPAVIIVGQDLHGLAGIDALFLASRSGGPVPQPEAPVRTVFFVTDVRQDVELLDFLRTRGVTDFLYRDDPVSKTVDRVLANFLPDRRAGMRNSVRLDVSIRFQGREIAGSMYDMTFAGAQLVVAAEQLEASSPSVGQSLQLHLSFSSTRMECGAVVRRLSMQESFFGKRVMLGVQFQPLDDSQRNAMEMILAGATEELELARRG